MALDEKFLMEIIEAKQFPNSSFILQLGRSSYILNNISIFKSSTTVNRPTKRGGIFFSDTFAFKIKGDVSDLSIVDLLSKSMLGPNPEFQNLEITTNLLINNSNKKITFYVNLTNSMQNTSRIELNMTIIKFKIE
ncbi:MAG TPA: hypothetical protein VD731_05880 [Nitrosopumilaceae archaeon]|nr:hypothetical protein [Nitrosopumilaceae archaeon]